MPAANRLSSRNIVFKDLDLDFDIHPNTRNINKVEGDKAVARALKHLVLTDFYERPFHPEIGTDVRASLFDNIMPSTAMTIQNAITEVIENYEPRAELLGVDVYPQPDENGYSVDIVYRVINQSIVRHLTFFLERIR